jgi:SAM-dependent methyltransferase
MYDDIVDVYNEIFPLNQAFLVFLNGYLGEIGSRVLDLGCGPGDYVGLLAEEGYEVVGIDSSVGMIEAAKAKHHGRFYPYSFTEIGKLRGHFDCVYCVGNSLSYLPNDLLPTFMAETAELLKDFGRFILQVVNWDRFVGMGRINFDVKALSDGRTFHRGYEPMEYGTVIFHTSLQKEGELLAEWADSLHPKTLSYLRAAILSSGLDVVGAYGDYDKAPFDSESSPALILVAEMQKH